MWDFLVCVGFVHEGGGFLQPSLLLLWRGPLYMLREERDSFYVMSFYETFS